METALLAGNDEDIGLCVCCSQKLMSLQWLRLQSTNVFCITKLCNLVIMRAKVVEAWRDCASKKLRSKTSSDPTTHANRLGVFTILKV